MLKKIFFLFSIFVIAALVLSTSPVLAKNDKNADDDWILPEQDGTYDVPGHPELKVRVFVHRIKPPKPDEELPQLVCDLPDPNSSAIVDGTGWRLPSNWTYNLNLSSVPRSVGSNNLAIMTSDALSRWKTASGKAVTFSSGPTTTINRKAYDGENIIAWGRISGSALGITYVWYYPSTGLLAEADTIMNNKFSWTWSGGQSTCAYSGTYDAQNILTHELGHWMGLDDEYASNYTNNTMYGYGLKMEVKKDTLTNGDVTGLSQIY